jgi:hypothetical protein
LRNECATVEDYGIIHFFKGVAAIPRSAAWNLLCHSATDARDMTALKRNPPHGSSSDARGGGLRFA